MPARHADRLASLIQTEVASLLSRFFRGEKYGLLTVTDVRVSGAGDSARVFVSCLKNGHNFAADAETHIFALQKALNLRLRGQKTPRLILERDSSAGLVAKVGELPEG